MTPDLTLFIFPRPRMTPIEVLFIEDSAGDALLMRQILSEFSVPVNLRLARDAKQALIILDSGYQPGLIILDLNIPGVPGYALLEQLPSRKIPVVIFSSSSDPTDVQRSLALGAREYVQKPSDLDAYKDSVWRIIDKWAARGLAD
jgi:CheY-like chemotaxis protein